MDLKIFNYIKQYIEKRYPQYINILMKGKLLSSVLKEVSDKFSLEAILNHEADKLIDIHVQEILVDQLGDAYFDYDVLHDNVWKSMLSKEKKSWYAESVQADILDSFIRESIIEICGNDSVNYKQYISDDKIQMISNKTRKKCDRVYDECFNYVANILNRNKVKEGCNLNTYDYLLENTVSLLVKKYNILGIINGDYDEEILLAYNFALEEMKNEVSQYVEDVLNSMDLPMGMNHNLIKSQIIHSIFEVGNMSVADLFDGRVDNYIMSYANRMKNLDAILAAKKYVLEKINNMNSIEISSDELNKMAEEICWVLRDEYKFFPASVCAGKCDDLIAKLFQRKMMVYSSVEVDNKPRRIKRKARKKQMPLQLKTLFIIGILMMSLFGGKMIYTGISDKIQYDQAVLLMEDYSDYKYPPIYSKDNNNVVPTAISALDFYNKVKDSGYDNGVFCYLGFYFAYDSVKQDKLYVMDEIYRRAILEACYNDKYAGIKDEIKEDRCYLDFVVRRLYEMGYVGIKQDKYMEVIYVYKQAKRFPDKKPMDLMTMEQREVIEEIMETYREYCKKYVMQFHELLPKENGFGSSDKEIVPVSVDGSRRSI